jgi:hypothetical protein
MKGVDMGIKLEHQNRTAEYGIALGILIHAAWRGLARLLASGAPARSAGSPLKADFGKDGRLSL